jgi:hypothetical protein
MEPVSTAILAAVAGGLAQAAGETVSTAVADAYGALKSLLRRRFGNDSPVATAVDQLEAKPDSQARQALLREELAACGADRDPDLVNAARSLLDELAKLPGGEAHIQQATGSYIAQADRGGTAGVYVNAPEQR